LGHDFRADVRLPFLFPCPIANIALKEKQVAFLRVLGHGVGDPAECHTVGVRNLFPAVAVLIE
jgi:hypothetical protein